jgi:FMN reductase (NADPH)
MSDMYPNSTIELLQRHRSVRRYQPTPLQREQIEAILTSAQMASSSSNIQAYSVIGVTEAETKKRLAQLAGNQAYVEQCPLFLVWCADVYRLREASLLQESEAFHINTECFITATVDAALAAQNAAVAAESLGLGICYIGGIRNNPREVSELLKLPELVYPVFGMCVGVPAHSPDKRPRFDTKAIYHEETYRHAGVREHIEHYDEVMERYYQNRSGGTKATNWSQGIAEKFSRPVRPHMRSFLEERGFRFT